MNRDEFLKMNRDEFLKGYDRFSPSAIAWRKRYWKHLMPPHPDIKRLVIDKDGFMIGYYADGWSCTILGRAWIDKPL